MSMALTVRNLWAPAALMVAMAAPLAAERIVIDVSQAKRSSSGGAPIHYQGTGSIRHSDNRSYASAQRRHSIDSAEERRAASEAGTRSTRASESRVVADAGQRRHSGATDRYGSVRLDTVR